MQSIQNFPFLEVGFHLQTATDVPHSINKQYDDSNEFIQLKIFIDIIEIYLYQFLFSGMVQVMINPVLLLLQALLSLTKAKTLSALGE